MKHNHLDDVVIANKFLRTT